ncbi:MAG: LytTR family DNA-binding domain-containing protein [Panacibacter sp.]
MKFTCVIVEDEEMSMRLLKSYCSKTDILELKGTFYSAEDAHEFLAENTVDIIFLDVEMSGISGFDLLDQLTDKPHIVLTTSKTDYAFTAFQYHVADFLKKPVGYKRFQETIEKFTKLAAVSNNQTETVNEDDIFIKANGKLVRISLHEILYIECIGDYVKYVTENKNYIAYTTIKNVEAKMNGQLFLKTHRSYIVNMKKIKDVHINENYLMIKDASIPISRAKKAEVMQRLKVF